MASDRPCTYGKSTVVLFISGNCVAAFRLTFFCLTVSICLLTLLMLQSGFPQHVSVVWIWFSSCFLSSSSVRMLLFPSRRILTKVVETGGRWRSRASFATAVGKPEMTCLIRPKGTQCLCALFNVHDRSPSLLSISNIRDLEFSQCSFSFKGQVVPYGFQEFLLSDHWKLVSISGMTTIERWSEPKAIWTDHSANAKSIMLARFLERTLECCWTQLLIRYYWLFHLSVSFISWIATTWILFSWHHNNFSHDEPRNRICKSQGHVWSLESALSAWRPPGRGTIYHCTCVPLLTLTHLSGDWKTYFFCKFCGLEYDLM